MRHAPICSHIPAIQPRSHKASPTSDDRPTAAPTTTPLTPEEVVKEAREWVAKVLGHKPSKGQAQKIAAEETELAMAAIEDQLVEQLEEDGLDESLADDEDEDVDDPEEMEGYGTELKMGDSGEESFSSSSEDGDHVVTPNSDSLSLMVADVALDESAIIQNLDTNIDIAFLFTSAQPTSHSDGNSIHLFFPTSNNKLPLPIIEDALPDIQISAPHSEPHSNRQATGMLNLLRAEDALVDAIRAMLDLGVDRNTLQPHISDNIGDQLFRQAPPPLFPVIPVVSRPRSASLSPEIALPVFDSTGPRILPGFEPQKKSRRHPSHGLRR